MPRRSNAFQALVYRIESLLHDRAAKVEESALVENQGTGKTEEIDILVSFELAGRQYRMGIAVRERSRDKGDKDWVRALSVQRTQCKLDRMIAAHSRGFTDSASKVANELNVELLDLSEINDEQLRQALLVVDAVEICRVRFHNLGFQGLGYQSREQRPPSEVAEGDHLELPGRARLSALQIRDRLTAHLPGEVASASLTDSQRSHVSAGGLVLMRFRVPLVPGAQLVSSSGQRLSVSHIVGKAEVQCVHAHFDATTVRKHTRGAVLEGRDPQSPADNRLLIVPGDGSKFKVQAEVVMNAGRSALALDFPDVRVDGLS